MPLFFRLVKNWSERFLVGASLSIAVHLTLPVKISTRNY